MHRHANIRHVAETYGAQVLGIRPDDVTFSIAKLFFAYGIGNSVFFPLSVGATALLDPRRPTPQMAQERLAADRPTLFFAVPTFYGALLASDLPDDAFASVRLAASAGEPLPGPMLRRFKDRFGVDIIDGIGSTEALHIFLSNRPGDIRPGTTGTPVPGYDVVVRDDDGREAGPGQPGALQVRGESIALGYWRRTAATRQVFQGEWLVTGDTYVRDDDGYYTCLGRNSDMLKAGGIWVSPAEVESRLIEHPLVREAAVVGLADEHGIDKPVAVVVADGVTEAELVAWCRDGMAHYKAPRRVMFVRRPARRRRPASSSASRSGRRWPRRRHRALRDRRRLRGRQRQVVRRGVPRRLHLRGAAQELHQPARVHRLRRMRTGVPGGGDLPGPSACRSPRRRTSLTTRPSSSRSSTGARSRSATPAVPARWATSAPTPRMVEGV